ncbi:MAG: hypothetical protein A2W31_06830 [Planctomycetes bacterium RBG_16_64_10]|nr:MAG: hypothetical protein A2W31_06830 [Planctomycetes bacterium RBG_16_64_10]
MNLKAIVTSRITQLILKGLAVGAAYVAAKYGVTLDSLSPGDIAVIVSAVCLGYDSIIHRITYGVWLWHPDKTGQ